MAKRAARSSGRKRSVRISYHLKKPLEAVIKEAKALKGKVVEDAELRALVTNLERLQAMAQTNCPFKTWGRTFTLASGTARKR
jgi:hypothetical protein